MTSRTVREASGLQSLTSTLYLRLRKTDRDASFHCSVHYLLPKGQHGRLDSPPFGLTLHCESMLALLSHLGPHTSLRPDPPSAPPHTHTHCPLWPSLSPPHAGMSSVADLSP